VAVNRPVDEATTKTILEKLSFFEIILAPSYDAGALKLFEARKNLRVMTVEGLGSHLENVPGYHLRRVEGGFLVQEFDQAAKTNHFIKL
jgi:phosphoribosylaminoimidazolecarboxamide formyltransferase / IMP cyclohydrolase